MDTLYLFVVDTESYAGNFERPLCAFVTGQVGECGVGEELAEQARKEIGEALLLWFDANVAFKEEDGVARPVGIRPTPGWYNDGYGGHYREGEDPQVVRERFEKNVRAVPTRIDHASILKAGPGRFPSYQSVEIYLDKVPTAEIFKLMEERVRRFAVERPDTRAYLEEGETPEPLTVTAVRLVKQTTIVTEEDITP